MRNGYDFAFKFNSTDWFIFPITPSKLKITVGSTNETVTLINEGEINIPKAPSLIEVSFEARLPMRKYPYSKEVEPFVDWFSQFQTYKTSKLPFQFIVARYAGNETTWDTNLTVVLEDFEITEDASEGDDVLVDINLKQYKSYGTKTVKVTDDDNTVETDDTPSRVEQPITQTTYVIKNGDTLWGIAKNHYGNGAKWTVIYEANKQTIEDAAKAHGKNSSMNGHWIWANTTLIIPNINNSSE